MTTVSRRTFFATSSVTLLAAAGPGRAAHAAQEVLDREAGGLSASFPTQDPDVVREVVGKAHVNYERVRELVTPRPALAKSTWDWGFGDWESALGAASHMGRHDIVELLMEHGARPDLFTFAMLDQVDVVRAYCEANPGMQRLPGPHGITLMRHAVHGKADRVVEYLEQLGDADLGATNLPLSEEAAAAYVGRYEPLGAPGVVFIVKWHERTEGITFAREGRQMRFLRHLGDHAFSPGGAAAVRIEFDVPGIAAKRLVIRDGDVYITAPRLS